MAWLFDQAPNVACIADRSVMNGKPVLTVAHYEEDHSWAFLDGSLFDPADAIVVAMSEVLDRHIDLAEVADLPPGWSATRIAKGQPWSRLKDELEVRRSPL